MKLIDKHTTIKKINDFNLEDYSTILDTINYGLWKWDIQKNTLILSDKFFNILGFRFDVPYIDLKTLVHPLDWENLISTIKNCIYNKKTEFNLETRLKQQNDEYIWISSKGKISYNDSEPIKILGSILNITETKDYEKKLFDIAFFDSQTKLPNINLLKKDLVKLCELKNKFAVVFLDIDNFKMINDTLGHDICDIFLERVAMMMSSFSNENCKLYRRSGDEFIFTVQNIKDAKEVIDFAKNVQNYLCSHMLCINDNKLFITTTSGISIYPDHTSDSNDLVKFASKAMYYTKSFSKNSCTLYSPCISINALKRVKMENDVRSAIQNNEFQVFYQPQVNIDSRKLIGMEALARWIKPDGTTVMPNEFIPIAEESGLIVSLGEFVLKSACRQTKYWHDKGFYPLKISVNISEKQLEDTNFIDTIYEALEESELDPKCLELEITESTAIKDLNNVIELLKKLKNINVRIALDDFGTGYSSLSYLRELPLNTIKIDKCFMNDIEHDYKKKAIMKSMIILSHDIDLNIICEGVETESQLEFLKSVNCNEVQGFYFGKPVSLYDFENNFLNVYSI